MLAGCIFGQLIPTTSSIKESLTGELSALFLLFRPFLIWLFSALESSGLRSSKLQSSSELTLITAPQLSNSPQYYRDTLAMSIFPSPINR
jgi:hypothetical protein